MSVSELELAKMILLHQRQEILDLNRRMLDMERVTLIKEILRDKGVPQAMLEACQINLGTGEIQNADGTPFVLPEN